MLMPTLFQGELVTRERPCSTLASLWAVFAYLKHDVTLANNGNAFTFASRPRALTLLLLKPLQFLPVCRFAGPGGPHHVVWPQCPLHTLDVIPFRLTMACGLSMTEITLLFVQ